SKALVEESLKFLTSRPRSRLIWLTQHPQIWQNPSRGDIRSLRDRLTREFGSKGLTANELILGISEEFLLRRSPKSPSIKAAFEELKSTWPHARLLEPGEIAAWVMFLCSPLSQALNGHSLFIDHGLSSD